MDSLNGYTLNNAVLFEPRFG